MKIIARLLTLFLLALFSFSLLEAQNKPISQLIEIYKNPQNYPNYIMVAAHRGYWKDKPENSLSAIQAAIDLGVDMIELDLRQSKDGVLVVAHDRWLGRITTNHIHSDRPIDQMDYNEFKNEYLLDPYGEVTSEHIPTFSQALDLTKNKILVNLDKIEGYFEEVYNAVKAKGILNQVIFKFKAFKLGDPQELRRKYGSSMINSMMLTPIIFADNTFCFPFKTPNCRKVTRDQLISSFMNDKNIDTPGFELIFINEEDPLYFKAPEIRNNHQRLIQYPEWPESCLGNWDPNGRTWRTHTRQYIAANKRNHWDWLVSLDTQHRPDLIISDRLEILVGFLELHGLRNLK